MNNHQDVSMYDAVVLVTGGNNLFNMNGTIRMEVHQLAQEIKTLFSWLQQQRASTISFISCKASAQKYLHVDASHYQTMFRLLWQYSNAVRNAMMGVVVDSVKQEMEEIKATKTIHTLVGVPCLNRLSSFSWKDVLQEGQNKYSTFT